MNLTLNKLIEAKDYQKLRQIFFSNEVQFILKNLLTNKKYDINTQKLDVLLNQLSDVELFCYIWRDLYSRAYVFSVEDQRVELCKSWDITKDIMLNQYLREKYIENHDDFIKKEYNKLKGSLIEILI